MCYWSTVLNSEDFMELCCVMGGTRNCWNNAVSDLGTLLQGFQSCLPPVNIICPPLAKKRGVKNMR